MPAFEMSANGSITDTIIIEMTCDSAVRDATWRTATSLVSLNEAIRFAEALLQRMYGTSSGAYVPFVIVSCMPGESHDYRRRHRFCVTSFEC